MTSISSLNFKITNGYPYRNPLAVYQKIRKKEIEFPAVFAVTKISEIKESVRKKVSNQENGNLVDIYA